MRKWRLRSRHFRELANAILANGFFGQRGWSWQKMIGFLITFLKKSNALGRVSRGETSPVKVALCQSGDASPQAGPTLCTAKV